MRHSLCARFLIIVGLVLVFGPPVASANGTIEGTVTFWGDPGGGTQVEVGAHSSLSGPPDESVFVNLPSDSYSIPIADGSYYISVLMARDGSFGEPRPEDVLVWYDADGDGEKDTVTVSGGAVTGIDIDLGFVYVDIDATGGANNGSSWTDAFTSLHSAISAAVSGVEVWVAEGTYTPGGMATSSFGVKSGVRVCGGFTGGETVRQQRDWRTHTTTLSCEIGGPQPDDNCFHVVTASNSNTTAVLDGFTLTRGYADGGGTHNIGGGVNATGVGGVTIVNARIVDNFALHYGGGIHTNNNTNVVVVNTYFIGNGAGYSGGGFYLHAAAPDPSMAVNCVFTGNTALTGGGIYVYGPVAGNIEDRPKLVNFSLSDNSANEGGGIYTQTSDNAVTIENSILWGNSAPTGPELWYETFFSIAPVVNDSIVQGGWSPGTHIVTGDPGFTDGDLRIGLGSPAVDAGDSTALPDDTADVDEDHFTDHVVNRDLDSYWRTEDVPWVADTGVPDGEGRTVDMGAYEASIAGLIFWDDFESGGTDEWDNTSG